MADQGAQLLRTGPQTHSSELKDVCTQKWRQLKQMQTELNSLRSSPTPVAEDNPISSINHADEKLLKAQIDLYRNACLTTSGFHGDVAEALLLDNLTRTNKQLQETLYFVQSQLEDLRDGVQRQTEINNNLQRLALAVKADSAGEPASSEMDASDRSQQMLAEITRKQKNLSKTYNLCMQEFNAFMKKNFPVPTVVEIEQWAKKVSNSEVSPLNVVSLKSITEELMNRCSRVPHDPYMTLNSTHWPPYIELLLSCGIALRHPEDHTKIKLTPFHL